MSDTEIANRPKYLAEVERIVLNALASADVATVADDPYCGSGTTLIDAGNSARSFLGCEIDVDIAKMARRRVKSEIRIRTDFE